MTWGKKGMGHGQGKGSKDQRDGGHGVASRSIGELAVDKRIGWGQGAWGGRVGSRSAWGHGVKESRGMAAGRGGA